MNLLIEDFAHLQIVFLDGNQHSLRFLTKEEKFSDKLAVIWLLLVSTK
jgi:hypothetical protein